jgi:hypothetical protein
MELFLGDEALEVPAPNVPAKLSDGTDSNQEEVNDALFQAIEGLVEAGAKGQWTVKVGGSSPVDGEMLVTSQLWDQVTFIWFGAKDLDGVEHDFSFLTENDRIRIVQGDSFGTYRVDSYDEANPGKVLVKPALIAFAGEVTVGDPAFVTMEDLDGSGSGGGGINVPSTRENAVMQVLPKSDTDPDLTWQQGMALAVVQDVPDDNDPAYEIGDVVFVLGDDDLKDPNEGLEGFGGWAEITSLGNGTTDSKPKRYTGIMVDGVEFWAFEWTGAGSVTMTKGIVDALLVGGGMGYMNNLNNSGGGGSIVTNLIFAENGGNFPIEIGVGKPAGSNFEQYTGTPTSVGPDHTGYSYSAGFSYFGTTVDNVPERGEPYPSSITGSPETYAGGKKNSTTRFGDGGANAGNSGRDGVVIIRVPASKVTATGGWV